MIDVLILRIIAGVLLASSIVLIYIVNFRSDMDGESFETQSEIDIATSIEVVGGFATIVIPLLAIILLVLLPMTVYETVLNFYFLGDTVIQLVGIFLYLGGGALLIWSARHLGKFDVGKIAVAQDHVLVDTGPYARVRHPGYTATFLIAFAVLLIMLNILLIVNLVVVVGYFEYRAQLEEKLLSSQDGFGDQYLIYKSRIGRFFPKLRQS